MKTIIFFTLFIGMALAAPQESVPIVKSSSVVQPDGSYSYSYEGADGSAREETGVLRNGGTDQAFVAQSGFYKYIDVNGAPVEVHYTSDENGFVPFGTNILESITAAAKALQAAGKK